MVEALFPQVFALVMERGDSRFEGITFLFSIIFFKRNRCSFINLIKIIRCFH